MKCENKKQWKNLEYNPSNIKWDHELFLEQYPPTHRHADIHKFTHTYIYECVYVCGYSFRLINKVL